MASSDPWLLIDWDGFLAFVGTETEAKGAAFDLLRIGRAHVVTALDTLTPDSYERLNARVMDCRIVEAVDEWCADLTIYADNLINQIHEQPHPLAVMPPPTDWRWLKTNPLGGVRWWTWTHRVGHFNWHANTVVSLFSLPDEEDAEADPDALVAKIDAQQRSIIAAHEQCRSTKKPDWIVALATAATRERDLVPPAPALPDNLSDIRRAYDVRAHRV